MDNKQIQGIILSLKTVFLIYISISFLVAFENITFLDSRWGLIFSQAILFAVPFLTLDYVVALLRYFDIWKDGKLGGIFIFDLFLDQAPKFPTKDGFVPDYKGFILQIVLGLVIFSYFWNSTVTTGTIYAGVPALNGPAQLTPVGKADKTALVAPPENVLSTTLMSIIAMGIAFGLSKIGIKGMAGILMAMLVGAYFSSLYMADLHSGVYKFDQLKLEGIQRFFFVGNIASAATGAQYAFDVYHALWNKNLVQAGYCIGCS